MRVILTIDTANDTFGGPDDDIECGKEIAAILLVLARLFRERGGHEDGELALQDHNGNTCGKLLTLTNDQTHAALANARFVMAHGAGIPGHVARFALKVLELPT